MHNRILTIIAFLLFSGLVSGQDCQILNENGSFEEMIYVPGGEPSIGITTGQIANWSASHGTADYITSDWNWYDLDGITSNAGHLCYGNRDAHDHSEGIYTSVDILGDEDLLYTLSVDYATVCEASENGFLNIALNNNLSSEGHNWFQYPTPVAFPEYFEEIQPIERLELFPEDNFDQNGMSTFEVSFVPTADFSQIWLFTEYQHEQTEFLNCGLILDNLKVTATTNALSEIQTTDLGDKRYNFAPQFDKDLDISTYSWTVDHQSVSQEESFDQTFINGSYTICLDVVDQRGACGTACYELEVVDATPEEVEEGSDDIKCTYSACLDLPGQPNIQNFQFINSNGESVLVDDNTTGFYFPYCLGEANMCAGGENELDIFIEDLNAYFYNQGIEAIVSIGYSEFACRTESLNIKSSGITPESIAVADFQSDSPDNIIALFEYNPSDCVEDVTILNDITLEDIQTITESDLEEGAIDEETNNSTGKEFFKPVVEGSGFVIQPLDASLELIDTDGGIYNSAGQLIMDLSHVRYFEEVNIDHLPVGVYLIRLINKNNQQSEFIFKGE